MALEEVLKQENYSKIFICQLSAKQQEVVKKTIENFLISINHEYTEKNMEETMNGRLCDLEDDINLNELIKKIENL